MSRVYPIMPRISRAKPLMGISTEFNSHQIMRFIKRYGKDGAINVLTGNTFKRAFIAKIVNDCICLYNQGRRRRNKIKFSGFTVGM